MRITRKRGKVVLVGDIKLNFEKEEFYSKEIDLIASYSYGPGRREQQFEDGLVEYPRHHVRWDENRNMQYFVSLMEEGKLEISGLITKEYPFEEAHTAYKRLRHKNTIGIVLRYGAVDDNMEEGE